MASSDREERRANPSSKRAGETAPQSVGMITLPGQFGPYRVKKLLGGGGMGAVYLVENTKLEREEALKVPHFEPGSDPEVKKRFLIEARAAAKLDHANLCQVYDADEIDGQLFMTMRYLKGRPLSDYAGVPQPPRKAVEVVTKLAQALEFAHGKGIIHRDLKPNNVMMCPGAGPTVMDFGLARQTKQQDNRLTRLGAMLGTPWYMPPEQVKGELDKMGPASDVYSLGVILYELLTGRLPFEGAMTEVFGKVLYTEPPLPSQLNPALNPTLDKICCQSMAKDPGQRYPTMKAFAAALADYLKTTPPTEGAGNLVINPEAVKAANPPPNIFQAQTMAPAAASPRNQVFNAETVAPRKQILNAETQVGGKISTVNKPGKSGTKRLRPDREEEKVGVSAGTIIGLIVCVFLVLGALGGVGGLIYAVQQKKAKTPEEVVEQPIEPVEPRSGGAPVAPTGSTVKAPEPKRKVPEPKRPDPIPDTPSPTPPAKSSPDVPRDVSPPPAPPPPKPVVVEVAAEQEDEWAKLGFSVRSPAERAKLLRAYGGNERSEKAVADGLRWLALHQCPDGHWSLHESNKFARTEPLPAGKIVPDDSQPSTARQNDVAGTAFGLLPFLAAGFTHKRPKEKVDVDYSKGVGLAVRWLLTRQTRFGPTRGSYHTDMYAHALATIAMCEVYGLTADPNIKTSAQLALNYIAYAQDPSGGGWRYAPRTSGDTSVTSWHVTALKTGLRAGLIVPRATLTKAVRYLDGCESTTKGGYGYVAGSPESISMTAAGALSRLNLGLSPRNPSLLASGKRIKGTPPGIGVLYYEYYATQVMFHLGGEAWELWNFGPAGKGGMRDTLIAKQDDGSIRSGQKGSWAGADIIGGRLGATSLSLLSLQVYYRHPRIIKEGVGK